MAAAAAAASEADLDSSVLVALTGIESSSGAGWSHFRFEDIGGSSKPELERALVWTNRALSPVPSVRSYQDNVGPAGEGKKPRQPNYVQP
jgi:hypothetical protein